MCHDQFVIQARRILAVVALSSMAACTATLKKSTVNATKPSAYVLAARQFAREAASESRSDLSSRAWLQCASAAYLALNSAGRDQEASSLSAMCTDKLMQLLLTDAKHRWTSTTLDLAGLPLTVELRDLSPSLTGPIQLVHASSVALPSSIKSRAATAGFGVPLVAVTARCTNRPICKLYPAEGVFRPATAWVEESSGGKAHLVVTDPTAHPNILIDDKAYPLAIDLTAPYALLLDSSRLNRFALWNLIGGTRIGALQGLYLLQDYDPAKTPIIMIHGLGASPLIWARLTNRILESPDLRARYQIWHVIYQTNAPVLVNRLRVQEFLDSSWNILDPTKMDPSRHGIVLIGHSMGGVVARLLTADSGDVLWNAMSTDPFDHIRGDASDLTAIHKVLFFKPYEGVTKAIFLASPHLGSPLSDDFIGRLAMRIVMPKGPELDALRRIMSVNAPRMRSDLLADYRKDGVSSISTLSANQPVSRAAQSLMPAAGIRYYTIAGDLPGAKQRGDGVVPLASAILRGAASTTIVISGHQVYDNDKAISRVVTILDEHP